MSGIGSILCTRLAWALLLCAALLPGCGRKGAPVPPRAVVPGAASEVVAETQPDGIVLSWTRPWRNSDGSALGEILEFRVWRAVAAPVAGTATPAWGTAPLAVIAAGQPENAVVQGGRYSYWDGAGLESGMRYRYRIQAIGRGGDPGLPSPEATVEFLPPPPPPADVAGRMNHGVVELTWRSPELPAGRKLFGYNVYRRIDPGRYGRHPVNGEPLTAPRFRDVGLSSDATYGYVVRSVDSAQLPWKESPNSIEVLVRLEDVVPPAPPQGLVAVPGLEAISLTWAANAEPDVLGYLVYRREVEATGQVRLTEAPVPGTTYTDRTVKPGASYAYAVTAVDRSVRRNESAPSAEAEATLLK
jgi:hypothetical protein